MDTPNANLPASRQSAASPAGRDPRRLRGAAPAATPGDLLQLLATAGASTEVLEATSTWIARRRSANSRTAYAKDASWWLAWCAVAGTDPATARAKHADQYGVALAEAGLSKSTQGRRLAVASSWYAYLVRSEVAERNPFAGMERPSVSADDSPTTGLTAAEIGAILTHAREHESTRTYALLVMLATTAARITSVLTATVGAMGYDQGHRCIDLVVKGDKKKRVALTPLAIHAIETHLATRREVRPDELLFPTRTGAAMDEPAALRLLRRVAIAADVKAASKISPHSFRHSFATAMLGAGVALHYVQDAMGHADPRTTRRYDRARGALDNSPAYRMAEELTKAMNAAG